MRHSLNWIVCPPPLFFVELTGSFGSTDLRQINFENNPKIRGACNTETPKSEIRSTNDKRIKSTNKNQTLMGTNSAGKMNGSKPTLMGQLCLLLWTGEFRFEKIPTSPWHGSCGCCCCCCCTNSIYLCFITIFFVATAAVCVCWCFVFCMGHKHVWFF